MTSVSLSVGVGLICALLSALGTNLAFLFKHRGAVAAPDVDMRHPLRSAVDLFRSRWWTIGWCVATVAFAVARLVPPCDVEWRRVLADDDGQINGAVGPDRTGVLRTEWSAEHQTADERRVPKGPKSMVSW